MNNSEKEILQMFAKYAEMINVQLGEMDYRLRILESAMTAHPEILVTYNEAVRDVKRRAFPPGLPRQLSAIQEAIEKLRD